MKSIYRLFIVAMVCLCQFVATAQTTNSRMVDVGLGWANNSINTVAFRRNALVTFGDTQFISYYDKDRYVVLGKRRLGTAKWELKRTPYQGNTADAHNTISIMIDGAGYLHMSWDHHNNPLRYCRSIQPG